jgi:HlyD family secretion protein
MIAVLALALPLLVAFWPRPLAVESTDVTRGPLIVTVNEDGRTRIRDRYVVSAPLGGHLQRVMLRPGDRVQKGVTLLASIQPERPQMLNARELAQAEARVKAAQAAVKRSEKSHNAARAGLDFTTAELTRARSVARNKVISRSELENAEMLFRTRTEELAAARYAEEIARFELELAQAALDFARPAEDDPRPAADLQIHSPIDGNVLRLLHESAQVVDAGTAILEVGDPTDLEVEVDVLSSDAVRIRPGARVWLDHWGGTRRLEGRVRLVEPSGYTKVSALGVEEQRVNVIVDLVTPADQREALRDGFRVEASIVIWENASVLQIPNSTLFRHGNRWAVFVITNNRAELRPIEIGHHGTTDVEVLHGLQVGEKIVTHPNDRLRNGMRVALREN